ncbi:MAG: histidine kinase [Rhodobacteraceae bacterium PARR1]|nr:MAG: histidine kinase [Rhodobacteraceae bacterium PARR1]
MMAAGRMGFRALGLPAGLGWRSIDSFAVRLGLVLTLALLPVGLMAMIQSAKVVAEARARSEAALAGETLRAVRPHLALIQQARGAVAVLAGLDPATCGAVLPHVMKMPGGIVFAGLYDPTGRRLCGAGASPALLPPSPEPGPTVSVARLERHGSILLALAPMEDGTGFAAFAPRNPPLPASTTQDFVLLLFDGAGGVLTSFPSGFGRSSVLPSGPSLLDLAAGLASTGSNSFTARTAAGPERAFSVVELVEGRLYALGSRPLQTPFLGDYGTVPVALFPALMWAVSLIAAWIAAETLVTAHIRHLRRALIAFAGGNRKVEAMDLRYAPPELRETAEAFLRMTQTILQDEARQEDSLRQKEALLRELHHRVKNNLQLIASIVNIQLRRIRTDEARHALTSLQDRMLGLATIHDRIYQTTDLSEVSVHRLFPGIVDKILRRAGARDHGLRVETSFDALDLPLDKAVPLALLLTEAVSDAVRHVTPIDGVAPVLRVSFHRGTGDEVVLEVINTTDSATASAVTGDYTSGIGAQLLRGFVGQLGGTFDRTVADGFCRVTIWLSLDDRPRQP